MNEVTFPGCVSPVRAGVYQVSGGFAFWSGEYWGCVGNSPDAAMEVAHIHSMRQNISWSGLSVDQYAERCHRIAILEMRRKVEYEFMLDTQRMHRIRAEHSIRADKTGLCT